MTEEEAIAVLGRVFTMTPEETVSSAPDFSRGYLNKEMLGGPGPEKWPGGESAKGSARVRS
jgi:hypothetical protein